MNNTGSINGELKRWVIDYERLNELTAGAVIENAMGHVNTKSLANREIKKMLQHFNEYIIDKKELSEKNQYFIDTLKHNKILVNIRQERIKKVFE